jgi:hypothetical protein
MSATSRDPEEWARATAAARGQRELTAVEVAEVISTQVGELIVQGDAMGGRSRLAIALQAVAVAERREDQDTLRAALMDVAVAAGTWVAALDFRPPTAGSASAPAEL